MDTITNTIQESSSECICNIRKLLYKFYEEYFQDRNKTQDELIEKAESPEKKEFHKGVKAGLIDASIHLNNLL